VSRTSNSIPNQYPSEALFTLYGIRPSLILAGLCIYLIFLSPVLDLPEEFLPNFCVFVPVCLTLFILTYLSLPSPLIPLLYCIPYSLSFLFSLLFFPVSTLSLSLCLCLCFCSSICLYISQYLPLTVGFNQLNATGVGGKASMREERSQWSVNGKRSARNKRRRHRWPSQRRRQPSDQIGARTQRQNIARTPIQVQRRYGGRWWWKGPLRSSEWLSTGFFTVTLLHCHQF